MDARVDASVSVDGKPTDAHASGAALVLDPGPHDLVAKLGTTSTTLHVVAREGERNRRVRIVLATVAATAPTARAVAPTSPSPGAPRTGPPVITWALGVVALAGLGTFVVAGLDGAADVRRLETSCARPCPDSELDPAARKFLVANIGLAVGVAALAAGAFFWWRHSVPPAGRVRALKPLSSGHYSGASHLCLVRRSGTERLFGSYVRIACRSPFPSAGRSLAELRLLQNIQPLPKRQRNRAAAR